GSRIGDHAGFEVLDRALELGVFHWDTACSYNLGSGNCERLMGRYFSSRDRSVREQVVLATKIHNPVRDEHQMEAEFTPNQRGTSRAYIRFAVDKCLERLQTDHIDLLYIHQDGVEEDGEYRVPLEETWGAFDDVISQGKVHYVAVSNHSAEKMGNAVETMAKVGKDGSRNITAIQNRYNLLERDAVACEEGGKEADLMKAVEKAGVGLIPFYPLASGMLTGRYRKDSLDSASGRIIDDGTQDEFLTEANLNAVEGLIKVAEGKGMSLAQLAIAWMLQNPLIPSVIAGVTKMEQLEDNVKAAQVELSEDDLDQIDEILKDAQGS
ncbi:MAG: aldo/keto reductase, partial [Candidatus Latescibacteria bacterium]|nr:aldo/keto reductase [Candidatus Latescibacterota bacterium]